MILPFNAKLAAQSPEAFIADVLVSVGIVHQLEVVEVQHDQRERFTVADAAHVLLCAEIKDGTAVEGCGECVVRGHVFELRAHAVCRHQQNANR